MIRGKTRHQLFLPDEMSKRLSAMAKDQKWSRSDLLLKMIDAYMNRRSGPQVDDRITAKLERIGRAVENGNNECFVISHTLYRFIRHQLIYAAALPVPTEDVQALLDSVAKVMARVADNDDQLPKTPKADEA